MASHPRPAVRRPRRLARLSGCIALISLLWLLAACGEPVQTDQDYNPADGVNADVGQLKVRNLMILSRTEGSGFLSGSLTADDRDALLAVAGVPIKPDGTDGQPLTTTLSDPVALGNGRLVVLTDGTQIAMTGPDLRSGLTARLELTFAESGKLSIVAPVVDGTLADYATVSPTPMASPSS